MKFVPFTVHFKVTQDRSGKRFETIRSLQKISEAIYNAVLDLEDVNVATPGGGQQRSYGQGSASNTVNGCTIKPQFGNFPAQLMLEGFYNVTSDNNQPYSELQLIHAGAAVTGPKSHSWDSNPTTTINNEVKALKVLLDSAISAASISADAEVSVFRIDYSGVMFGNKGFHFPQ